MCGSGSGKTMLGGVMTMRVIVAESGGLEHGTSWISARLMMVCSSVMKAWAVCGMYKTRVAFVASKKV